MLQVSFARIAVEDRVQDFPVAFCVEATVQYQNEVFSEDSHAKRSKNKIFVQATCASSKRDLFADICRGPLGKTSLDLQKICGRGFLARFLF